MASHITYPAEPAIQSNGTLDAEAQAIPAQHSFQVEAPEYANGQGPAKMLPTESGGFEDAPKALGKQPSAGAGGGGRASKDPLLNVARKARLTGKRFPYKPTLFDFVRQLLLGSGFQAGAQFAAGTLVVSCFFWYK